MRGTKLLLPLAIAAVAAVVGLGASSGSNASALSRYKVCTGMVDFQWCNLNEEHSYIQVIAGQNNFAGDPNTEYGYWCARLYNADTNTYHAKKCDFARAASTCYKGGGSHMRANGQNGNPSVKNGDNWGKQDMIVFGRTASDASC